MAGSTLQMVTTVVPIYNTLKMVTSRLTVTPSCAVGRPEASHLAGWIECQLLPTLGIVLKRLNAIQKLTSRRPVEAGAAPKPNT
jgi:hypothetical protein